MTIKELCESLKELGVIEVILFAGDDPNEVPYIEFSGRHETEYFHIKATNGDFAEHGL